MKVKNRLFEILARSQSLNVLASARELEPEMKFHVFELKEKIIEAEKPFFATRNDIIKSYAVDNEIPEDKQNKVNAEFEKVLEMEVELDHKILVIPKIPKDISANDMFNLRELVKFQNSKKKKK